MDKKEPIHISINVNLNGLRGELLRALQRATYLVACGLGSGEVITEEMFALPDVAFQMRYTSHINWSEEDAKKEFTEWVLLNGFREVTESIGVFLESAHRVLSLWSIAGKQQEGLQITGADWHEIMQGGEKRFHRLGLPDKLEHLEKEHGIKLTQAEEARLLSVNAARNCLVHRNGVVSERDVTSGDELVIQWIRMAVLAQDEDGEKELVLGSMVEKDTVVAIRNTEVEKKFRLRERISFSVKEFSEISWSVFLVGERVVSLIQEYGLAKGFIVATEDGAEQGAQHGRS